MKTPLRPQSPSSAFTLLELMMVINLLGVLAALLLTTMARARRMSQRIECYNNQRQLALTWLMYTSDNRDWLVPNGGFPAGPPRPATGRFARPRLWVQGTLVLPTAKTNRQALLDPQFAAFADYLHTIRAYVCPGDSPSVELNGESHPRIRSYALNAYLGWVGEWDSRLSEQHKVFWKQSQMTAPGPAGTFLFQDVQTASICFPYFGVRMQDESFFNFPSSAHRQRGVLSFADGHIESRQWADPRTVQAYSREYHNHNDPSPGNPDLTWLRERTTVKE